MSREKLPGDQLKPFHYSLCGAYSGVITRAVAQPLDVLKIRFQLQAEPIRRKIVNGKPVSSKYSGIVQAAYVIAKEEGITALWKGHVPAQALSFVYGSVLFVSYEGFKRFQWGKQPHTRQDQNRSTWKPFIFGGLAGMCATISCHPFDVIRTRFVAQGEPKIYTGLIQGIRCMAMEGGILTFYKGLVPTLLAIFPNSSFQFGFYHLFRKAWQHHFSRAETSKHGINVIESLACGALSGTCSKILLLPFDVVKKRLQIQGFEEARKPFGQVKKYTGMMNCFIRIVAEESIMGLFKGSAASVLKQRFQELMFQKEADKVCRVSWFYTSSVVVALTFFSYEQCCYIMRTVLSSEGKAQIENEAI